MPSPRFNVRVYGLWIKDKQILVTDEIRFNKKITKFPGGGLQYGEGLKLALAREWKEETGQAIQVQQHFYTTDFFQPSAFHEHQQVISIYFFVKPLQPFRPPIQKKPFAFEREEEGAQLFRWLPIEQLSADKFTLPIEQQVAVLLRDHL